ncbi:MULTISPECIES: dicarboxylate/amino acid:cation symporter [unclassified Siphonobacter]|uniref:dicarboxylate/amino acid:cation symporter n=1 Tax=unclassified Siphonobacter TaxID=2635712 RepID=UPI000CA72A0F|nr:MULTISPECIES: dicarboxylate/amino acid:cation symporter [unclassified Siphonobacter]MDQ1089623.1 Na+/H+-dicarboxylate symporter [Siphonobacter sp. SORGH_AS_1065]MDR6195872.1 Na+/H+-dicarboxylate symporter [Siphonobacter sp. SORGH_AS_0500]PKK37376.1 dicarboxylate/amino acid:cation symporter [Siphonobacter sp. SORGH_AS_0500]
MKLSITWRIFIGLVLGVIVGLAVHTAYDSGSPADQETLATWSKNLQILSKVFLRMIKMIIGPLVFSMLVVGIAKLGDFKLVGRIGGKTLGYFLFATVLSLLTGLITVNLLKPGKVMQLPLPPSGTDIGVEAKKFSVESFFYHIFPQSIVESMAANEILQIVVFSIFFGIATAAIGETGKVVIKALDAVSHVMFKIVSYVMGFAPFGVFGAIAAVVATEGLGIFIGYAYLIFSFFIGLFFFIFIVLWVICLVNKIPYFKLLGLIKDPALLSFSTASSEASMPQTIEALRKFGCSEKIISFVLPLGYSFNLDGSMMYMTFATAFIAQAYGKDLSTTQQITMLATLMLSSKGIAGVPRASLVIIAGTMTMFDLPIEGLALLLGIDQILDMGRSSTSVIGNAVATAVVSKWEGELDIAKMNGTEDVTV